MATTTERDVNVSSPRAHAEGYAVNVYTCGTEVKLAQVYGATPQEATARALTVRRAFEGDTREEE